MLRWSRKPRGVIPVLLTFLFISACASAGGGESIDAQTQRITELEAELNAALEAANAAEAEAARATAEREELRRHADELEVYFSRVERTSLTPRLLLEPVRFDIGSAQLREEDRGELLRFAATIRAAPGARVGLVGRTDSRGSELYNLELSARRASAVRQYLIDHGVEPWRIEVVAAGEHSPLVELHDETGNALNRSVQLVVMPGGEEIVIRSKPPGGSVYFFRVGSEWDSVRDHLDDEEVIAPYRVAEGDTNVQTYRGRTWYNVMIVRDGVKRFRCRVPVTRSTRNLIEVTFSGRESDKPCP